MRVIVTGAAGFIGANILRGLNRRGVDDIIAVDDLTDGSKSVNLVGARISDYFDRRDFYERFSSGVFGKIDAVFHEGACSDTMEQDGRYMLETNYRCSKTLLDACATQGVPLLYASSAATYGSSSVFREDPSNERPLNVYGYSKLLFDNIVRRMLKSGAQIAGFRYFNVYGIHEQHKGRMASVAFHHFEQFKASGKVKLFGAYGGYGRGEQERDFISVDDVVDVKLWFLENPQVSGVFNLGSGHAQPFNDIATTVINTCREEQDLPALTLGDQQLNGLIEYVDFPEALVGKYQCHTQADLSALRKAGYTAPFATVQQGVARYVRQLGSLKNGL